MNLNEVFMRTLQTLRSVCLLATAIFAQDLTKPSAALKDDAPADATAAPVSTGTTATSASPATAPSVKDTADLLVDHIIGREHFMMESMSHLTPMLETYVQNMKPDNELGFVPESDEYFLGRLDFAKKDTGEKLFVDEPSMWKKVLKSMNPTMPITYVPRGFISTMLIDGESFDRQHYKLTYVRREFLGDVRCLVFDVTPTSKAPARAFTGRIWVEGHVNKIVR